MVVETCVPASSDAVPQTRASDTSVRVRSSNFHIMINLNQQFSSAESAADAIRCMYHTLLFLFCDPPTLRQIIFIDTVKRPGTTFEMDIGKIDTEATIEYAKSGLHAHILMRVLHLTFIQINLPVLRIVFTHLFASFSPRVTLKNPYIHIDAVRDNLGNVREYLFKNVQSRRIRYHRENEYPDTQTIHGTVAIANMSNVFSHVGVDPVEQCEHHGRKHIHQP